MLTKLTIRNFKKIDVVEVELGDVVVFIGPNNSGKTSALQALWLWSAGVKEWASQRKTGVPGKRPGVTMSRLGLTQIPLRDAKHLWRNSHINDNLRENGEKATRPVFIDIIVDGETHGKAWTCGLEFYYANPESLYCRPLRSDNGERIAVPDAARSLDVAMLPPLSGMTPEEAEYQPGRVLVLLGQGRSGEVLRNVCLQVLERDPAAWAVTRTAMNKMFNVDIRDPVRDAARGVIELTYVDGGVELDIISAGRGLQQVLLLLAYINANRGAILLLDEPDAHLEVLRQREVYSVLTETARAANTQLLIASHSEVVMQEAIDRDVLVSFSVIGTARRVDDRSRGGFVQKALKEIRADDYYQAERKRFVLYLEGATDLAILRGFARLLGHPASAELDEPFVVYVANQPNKASEHFHALRPVFEDLRAFSLFDRLDRGVPEGYSLAVHCWRRREIENYIASREVLLRFATTVEGDDLVSRAESSRQEDAMTAALTEIEGAFRVLRKDIWSDDTKASDELLTPLFDNYYYKLGLSNRMRKTDFHILVDAMRREEVDGEVVEVLDKIVMASRARSGV